MPIRIDSLPPEGKMTALSLDSAFDELPEFASLYGGTIASTPAMPSPFLDPPAHPTDSAESSPAGKWSTSLQNVLDRPPATFPSRLVAGGVVFCAACVGWATTSQIEEIGQAQGRLVPQGEAYKIHPVVSGKIAQVYVQEGQTIKAGQVIASLDNEIAINRVEALRQEGRNYE
nr:biotin/lipoyl-binding protein [Leptolyngbya sp. Prado105]